MSREEKKPRFTPWLLAFALAIALTWYILNPAPGPTHLHRRDDDRPDAERRKAQAQIGGASRRFGIRPALQKMPAPSSAAADEDLPEWPEYLELD